MHGAVKKIRYLAEYALLRIFFFIFGLMPVDTASAIGGWIGRTAGPFMGGTKAARNNLSAVFPGIAEESRDEIIMQMWDNLGRIIAEYAHIDTIAKNRTEIINGEIIDRLRDDEKPGIFFGAHIGNWELGIAVAHTRGLALSGIFREPNNPYVSALLERARDPEGEKKHIPKTRGGARQIVKTLADGGHVAILIDQKYNEGLPVPFLGRPAMTSPAFVELAQRYECPLVPVRFERLHGAHFRLTVLEPLRVFDDDGAPLPAEKAIGAAHALLEDWIRKRPGQWLWLHRRWSSQAVQGLSGATPSSA